MSDKQAKRLRRQRRQQQQKTHAAPCPPAVPAVALPPQQVPAQRRIPPERRDDIALAVQQVPAADCELTALNPALGCEGYASVGALVLNTLALPEWWRQNQQVLPYSVQVGTFVVQPDPNRPDALTGFTAALSGYSARAVRMNNSELAPPPVDMHVWIAHRLHGDHGEYIDFSAVNYPRWMTHRPGGHPWRWPLPLPSYLWLEADRLPPWIRYWEPDLAATLAEHRRRNPQEPVFLEQFKLALQVLDLLGARPQQLAPMYE